MWTRYRHPVGNLPLLAGVPRSVVRRLGSLMTQVTVPAGQVIVTEGTRNSQFVLIDQGVVRVTRGDTLVAELGVGEFFGELSLLGDGRANATVTTVTEVEVYLSNSVEFDALLRSALGASIHETAARRSASDASV